MAIRIDLLPRYVGLRRLQRYLLLGSVTAVIAFAAILSALYYREYLRLQTLKENRDAYEKIAKAAEDAQKEAETKTAEAKPFQDNVNFFVDASRTGAERAALLDTIHRYIYQGAVISLVDLSDGQNLKFTAAVKTPDEYANFLNNLRRGTAPVGILFADLPSGAGILGYPNQSGTNAPAGQNGQPAQPAQPGQPANTTPTLSVGFQVYPNTINAAGKLREPIVIPIAPGEAAPAPAAGPNGPPPTP
jgi:hypothetical protein